MFNFLKKNLLFLLFPLLIILFSDFTLRTQNSLYKEKYKGAKDAVDSIEILILGNSRANYGVDPEAFDLYAYNLANLAQSIYFDKRIALSLLPDLPNLKYVFISIDYHSLAFSSQFNRDYWSYYGNGIKYKETNYVFANLSPTLFGYTPKVAYAMMKKRILNYLKHGEEALDFEVQEGVDIYKPVVKGFIAFEGRDTTHFTEEAFDSLTDSYAEIIERSDEKEEIVADLEDFVQILQANKVVPILLTAPTYSGYNEHLNKSYIQSNLEASKHIAERYDIEYWDFQNSDLFNLDDFYDMEHLNRKGALKFSTMLNDSINNMKTKFKATN